MRKLLFCVMAITALTNANAQDVPLATLQNGEETQLFYGADAFKEAMKVAENGNTITLSSGLFNAVDITKAVKIYGNGYELITDSTSIAQRTAKYPTVLLGDFNISIDSLEQQKEHLYMEGIYAEQHIFVTKHLSNAIITKCKIRELLMTNSINCSICQCRIIYTLNCKGVEFLNTFNSIINNIQGDPKTFFIGNSIVFQYNATSGIIKNCILYEGGGIYDPLSPDVSVYNSFLRNEGDLRLSTQQGNWANKNWNKILFGNEKITGYDNDFAYELTDEAQQLYKGTDGTQIGIYGGSTPFSSNLTIPRIVKKEIATKTEGGKLKVNIKVETGDDSL